LDTILEDSEAIASWDDIIAGTIAMGWDDRHGGGGERSSIAIGSDATATGSDDGDGEEESDLQLPLVETVLAEIQGRFRLLRR
jgi:hypothetical protein